MITTLQNRLSIELTQKQGEAYRLLTENREVKFLLYGGAGGGAKTFLSCFWLISMCYKYSMTRWFVGREELKRIRESWLPTFYKLLHIYKIPQDNWSYNGQDHYLQHYKGARIDLLDLKYLPSDPLYERYGSIEYTGGTIEEGGEVCFGAFDVLKSRIGRYNNELYNIPSKILITSNPKKNWLKTMFYDPYKAGSLNSQYAFIPAFAHENIFLDKGYLDNLNSITDPITRERLRDGNWNYDDSKDQLIQFDRITDLFTNDHAKEGEKYITADIARFGKDKTVIGIWNGYRCNQIITLFKNTIPQAAKEIKSIAISNGIPMSRVLVDEDGIGGGVKDILDCKGFIANTKAIEIKDKPCNYNNIKSQVSFMFAEKANESGVFIKVESEEQKQTIIEEVEQIRSETLDNDTKVSIISKDKVKEKIGRSPDYSDMLVIRFWFDLPHSTVITRWSIN